MKHVARCLYATDFPFDTESYCDLGVVNSLWELHRGCGLTVNEDENHGT